MTISDFKPNCMTFDAQLFNELETVRIQVFRPKILFPLPHCGTLLHNAFSKVLLSYTLDLKGVQRVLPCSVNCQRSTYFLINMGSEYCNLN